MALLQQLKSKSSDIAFIATFGCLWGIMEIVIGSYLHVFRVPFAGILISFLALLIFLSGAAFTGDRFAVIKMGAVACIVRLFSIGNIIIAPIFAIAIEAILANSILLLFSMNRFSYALTGGVILLYTFSHKLIIQGILFGHGIYTMYLEVIEEGSRVLGIGREHAFFVIAVLVLIHIVIGLTGGIIAFGLARQAKKRLGYE